MKTMGADEIRVEMVESLQARTERLALPWSEEIGRAMRAVPRHLFTGDAPLEEAYKDDALVTKRDERGIAVSSVSAPWLQAAMLGQLDVRPRDRVLEIGSGGYNAALLRELVGPDGSVTTVDIDPFVTDRARQYLDEAGYGDVEVICQDAEFPLPGGRTFDRIIVTVGTWDIAPSWSDQLAEDGRLVVPLRTMGLTRSWALDRDGDHLTSCSNIQCGFVAMRGEGAHTGSSVDLTGDGQVGLWLDEDQVVDAEALRGVLSTERVELWTGLTADPQTSYGDQDFWLAGHLDGFALITAQQTALDEGLVNLNWRFGVAATVTGSTLAYRAKARKLDSGTYEFGVHAHGPDAADAAERMAEQIRAWDAVGRPSPRLSVHPADTPDSRLPCGLVLDKRHTRAVISWPTA